VSAFRRPALVFGATDAAVAIAVGMDEVVGERWVGIGLVAADVAGAIAVELRKGRCRAVVARLRLA
jgi:hypothetical protein